MEIIRLKMLERDIIELSYDNKLSHIGSCLTVLPILIDIYQNKLPEEKVVVSCGHAHVAHAVVMEFYGIIKSAEANIKEHGIHCERKGGCDCSTGSLGIGLSIALGIALADRSRKVYCVISDGEATEGIVYEALNVKEKYKVDNLIVYCNYNGYGAYDETKIETLKRLPGIKIVDNSDQWFIQKFGQESHYKVLSEKEHEHIYEKVIL